MQDVGRLQSSRHPVGLAPQNQLDMSKARLTDFETQILSDQILIGRGNAASCASAAELKFGKRVPQTVAKEKQSGSIAAGAGVLLACIRPGWVWHTGPAQQSQGGPPSINY